MIILYWYTVPLPVSRDPANVSPVDGRPGIKGLSRMV